MVKSKIKDLKNAKAYSDTKDYDKKHLIMRGLIMQSPSEFIVDSEADGIVGVTHTPTGFRMHLPEQVINGTAIGSKQAKLKAMGPGRGMANFKGGGKGSYSKMKSQASQMKADLTNATKAVGEAAENQTPWSATYPATAAYHLSKHAAFSADLPKYLGYRPGVWYDEGVSGANQQRLGNLVTGAGLTGLGLASIPVLQYLFPERFEGKGGALAGIAAMAGMGAPWLANLPNTFAEINNFSARPNEAYSDADSAAFKAQYQNRAYNLPLPAAPVKAAFINLNLPINKMHLADLAAEQLYSGYIDHGQAAGLMQAAANTGSRPWFTVGDLAKAAIGAGAGAVAGTVAAKGIGLFMNVSPMEQNVLQGTGAALGTLINLGKLGF